METTARIAKNAAIYSGATILSKAVGFIMIPIYAHYLHAEGYGIIGMIDICLTLLSAVVARGMAYAITRFYYNYDSQEERNTVVSTGLFVMLAVVPILVGLALPFAGIISRLMLGKGGYEYYFILAFITFGLTITADTARTYVVVNQRAFLFSCAALLRLIVGLTLNIYLIVVLEMGVLGFLYSSLICAVLFGVFWHVYVFLKVGLSFSKTKAKEMLAYLLPLVPGYLAMLVKDRSGTVMLRMYAGISAVGIFEMVFKFVVLLPLFLTQPFFKTWDPKAFELSGQTDGPDIIARTFRIFISLVLFMSLLLAVVLPDVIRIISPHEFWAGIPIIVVLIGAKIMDAMTQFCQFGIFHSKQTHLASYIYVTLAGLSVLVGLPLIAHFGLLGAAWTMLVIEFIRLVLHYPLAQKRYRIPYDWTAFTKMALTAVACYLLIARISVESFGLETWCSEAVSPFLEQCGELLHLGSVKGGKLVAYVTASSQNLVNVLMKTAATLLYPVILLAVGVYRFKNLHPLITRFYSTPEGA